MVVCGVAVRLLEVAFGLWNKTKNKPKLLHFALCDWCSEASDCSDGIANP